MLKLLVGVRSCKGILRVFGSAIDTNRLVTVYIFFFEGGHDGLVAMVGLIKLHLHLRSPCEQKFAPFFAANWLALRPSGGLRKVS